ncbi:MAG: hypothetical protein J7L32_03350, partial [Thermoplasmata archaeon]|nr:hypothetical protein [Thermoplasmata archaeon]
MQISKRLITTSLVFLLISAALTPSTTAYFTEVSKHTPNLKKDDCQNCYNITIFNFKGLTYEKRVAKISYQDAIQIKQQFNNIDQTFKSFEEKLNRKLDVLIDYGILPNTTHSE